MQRELGRLEDFLGMGAVDYCSRFSSNSERMSFNSSDLNLAQSNEGMLLGTTPWPYHGSRSSVHLERGLHDQNSLLFLEKTWRPNSTSSYDSLETPVPKPTEEQLIEEIAALELEILNLERYLLSLYRTAFDQHLASSPAQRDHVSKSPVKCPLSYQAKPVDSHQFSICNDPSVDKICQSEGFQHFEKKKDFKFRDIRNWSALHSASTSPAHSWAYSDDKHCQQSKKTNQGLPKADPHHRSLADYLCTSLTNRVLVNPCRLSEDIIRCISTIYCRLSSPPTPQIDVLSPSPISSLSSSTTLSPQDPCDNWSSRCPDEATASPYQLNVLSEKDDPYRGMKVVPMLCVNGERFNYAAAMLHHYSNLIRKLEMVDPRNMEHNEKLAFWINIHNALVMHAFLAYGLEQDHMKSTASILKASYIINAHTINARVIQTSIFGCQPRGPEQSLRTLILPAMKFRMKSGRHIYALDRPEPLVHFALSLGARSDPAVRVYKTKSVVQELEVARDEFIRSNVQIHKGTRVILPKILQYYSRDASLSLAAIWEMVVECMTENQKKAIQGINIRQDKCFQWSSYDSSFRYIIQ